MLVRSAGWVIVFGLAVLGTACGGDASELGAFDLADAADSGETGDSAVHDSDSGSASDAGVSATEDSSAGEDDAALVLDGAAGNDANDARVESDAGYEPDAHAPHVDAAQPSCSLIFYRDADLDGYGDPAAPTTACSRPIGYVTNSADCYDANRNAKPGQTGRFAEHRGDGSFDYDCDGIVELLDPGVAQCPADVATATCPPWSYQHGSDNCDYDALVEPWRVLKEGWYEQVAACGEVATFGMQINWDNDARAYSCSKPGTVRRQICQ